MAHEDELSFTLEEFGLTEEDLAAYEAAQQSQQLALNPYKQRPVGIDLQRRLVDTFIANARQGWEKAFQGMAGDDHLLDPEPIVLTEWETREWKW